MKQTLPKLNLILIAVSVAIIILGVIVLGMLGYGWYTSYGPGSDKAGAEVTRH